MGDIKVINHAEMVLNAYEYGLKQQIKELEEILLLLNTLNPAKVKNVVDELSIDELNSSLLDWRKNLILHQQIDDLHSKVIEMVKQIKTI